MKKIYPLLLILILLSSCSQYKRFTYLQKPVPPTGDTLYAQKITTYKIQPADNLYIKVTSSISKSTQDLFNTESTSSSTALSGSQGGGLYLMGYIVDANGYITLPVIGKILVSGSTVEEATSKIQDQILKISSDARVEIKLLSFKISILGEVNSPGQYTIFSDRANILEVLSLAGDITYNGNRKKILILRSINNQTKPIDIDLTKRGLLKSENYFLQPNDIIYIEPYKTTAFRLRITDYSQFLTMITSTITAILLINNMK
jgi:polysaccharide export outer membrane protein